MTGLPAGVTLGKGLPLEQLRIVTPLGIRFRDVALDEPITHGLVVLVSAKSFAGAPTRLRPNPSGVFGFHSLPLLHDVEYPSTFAPPLASQLPAFPFVVMVADRLGRFLPVVFGIDLPLAAPPSPPVFDLDPDPAPVLDAYLFTAPTRSVRCGFAAVRVDLRDREAEAPAAHALVRVTVGDRSIVGVADDRGCLLILLPYPLLEQLRLGSPPGTGQPPPFEHSWPLTLEVFYRQNLSRPFGDLDVLPTPWTTLPGLKGILESQDPAWIWPTPAGPPVTTWTGTVTYDHEQVVRTQTVSGLWISRGLSPP
jgi:hypothetical protein